MCFFNLNNIIGETKHDLIFNSLLYTSYKQFKAPQGDGPTPQPLSSQEVDDTRARFAPNGPN